MIENRRSCCSIPPPDGRISPQDSWLCRTINAKRTRREGNNKKMGEKQKHERKTTIEAFGSCVEKTELHYRKCT
jgi:hypothetical protein